MSDNNPLSDIAVEILITQEFWNRVEVVMKWLYKSYPVEMKNLEAEAKKSRDLKFKATGASKSNDMRDLGLVPAPIARIINKFYDQSQTKKIVYRSFFKKYPKLRTCEKI